MIFNKKAFSLVEVLAAVFLLAGLIAIVIQLSYGNNRRLKKARQLRKIALLLELKMSELQQEYQGNNIFDLPSEAEGEFKEEENYFWSYTTQALQLPDKRLLLSLMKLPDNQLNSQMAETLRSVLSDTVIELKLTVEYRRQKADPFSYSLNAYFINYSEAPDFIVNQIQQLLPQGAVL